MPPGKNDEKYYWCNNFDKGKYEGNYITVKVLTVIKPKTATFCDATSICNAIDKIIVAVLSTYINLKKYWAMICLLFTCRITNTIIQNIKWCAS